MGLSPLGGVVVAPPPLEEVGEEAEAGPLAPLLDYCQVKFFEASAAMESPSSVPSFRAAPSSAVISKQ